MNTLAKSLAMAAVILAVEFPVQARAGIFLKITDGVQTVNADDFFTPGIAQFSGSIGNFTVSSDVGVGFPISGSAAAPILDLTSIDVITGAVGGTLKVYLTETDSANIPSGTKFLSSIVGNYVNSHATLDTYVDTANIAFGTGTLLSGGLLDNQSGVASAPSFTGLYSITEIVTVAARAGSVTSLDAIVIDAPEPSSLPVLCTALVALGIIGSRLASSANRSRSLAFG